MIEATFLIKTAAHRRCGYLKQQPLQAVVNQLWKGKHHQKA
jgi:hypothetical protein